MYPQTRQTQITDIRIVLNVIQANVSHQPVEKNVFIFIIHNSYMFRPYILAIFRELQVWPKHVGVVYNKYKNIVQIVVSEIFTYYTVV
jgi:hypothetical protein